MLSTHDLVERVSVLNHIVTSKKTGLLQFLLLIAVLVAISLFGGLKFLQAMESTNADFKPELKLKAIDYGDSESDEQYQMPYVFIVLALDSPCDKINETLVSLLDVHDHFISSTIHYESGHYINVWVNESVPVKADADFLMVDDLPCVGWCTHLVWVRLKLDDPDPSRGRFKYRVLINMRAILNFPGVFINPVSVLVSQAPNLEFSNAWVDVSLTDMLDFECGGTVTIGYKEKITRKWQGTDYSYITASLESLKEIDMSCSDVGEEVYSMDKSGGGYYFSHDDDDDECVYENYPYWDGLYYEYYAFDYYWSPDDYTVDLLELFLEPDHVIEYWAEYVAYDYYDWISAIGGLVSISGTCFFLGARCLAGTFSKDHTLGILPLFSLPFKNSAAIEKLKSQVFNVD